MSDVTMVCCRGYSRLVTWGSPLCISHHRSSSANLPRPDFTAALYTLSYHRTHMTGVIFHKDSTFAGHWAQKGALRAMDGSQDRQLQVPEPRPTRWSWWGQRVEDLEPTGGVTNLRVLEGSFSVTSHQRLCPTIGVLRPQLWFSRPGSAMSPR